MRVLLYVEALNLSYVFLPSEVFCTRVGNKNSLRRLAFFDVRRAFCFFVDGVAAMDSTYRW